MLKTLLKKSATLVAVVMVLAQASFVSLEPAVAAGDGTLSLGSATLRNGCAGSIPININTGSSSIWAVDAAMDVTGSATVNSMVLGSPLPMQACNDPSVPGIMLCGARQAGTTPYSGSGVYGTINVTPGAVGNLGFSFNLASTKMIDDSIADVLGSATGNTYAVLERYNTEVDGVGFCTPDTTAPIITVTPANGNNNAPVDTNITLALSDNRVGVDISTLNFAVNGTPVDTSSFTAAGGTYNPGGFAQGQTVAVTASVCDLENNCRNYSGSFRTTPPPPPPNCGDNNVDAGEQCDDGYQTGSCDRDCTFVACGDGVINDIAGEQCDDGNTSGGDGCSGACRLEIIVLSAENSADAVTCPAPEPVICANNQTAIPVDEATDDQLREAAPEESFEAEDFEREAQTTVLEVAAQESPVIATTFSATPPAPDSAPVDPCEVKYGTFGAIGDRDGDGLSDRAECYIGTDPAEADSDGDTCYDGEELNRFYTNPLESDCAISDFVDEDVVITDPKPNWILRDMDVSGTTPVRSVTVGITAFPAIHKNLSPVLTEFDKLLGAINKEVDAENAVAVQEKEAAITDAVTTVQTALTTLEAFIAKNPTAYGNLSRDAERIRTFLSAGAASIDAEQGKDLLERVSQYDSKPTFLGEVNNLQEVSVGNAQTGGFRLESREILSDGVYDLVATAGFPDGGTKSSAPVRIVMDSTLEVSAPTAKTIEGIPVDSDNIVVQVGRPILSGETVYGAQVFATWESLVLSSSIIADSAEGTFDVQAPRDLEPGEEHTVTLYAVTETDQGFIRSASTEVRFYVAAQTGGYTLYYIIAALVLLAIAAAVAKKRLKRIDKLSPEHRAKENELYEAFGEKHVPNEGETGATPPDHDAKEEEVASAFSGDADPAASSETPMETPDAPKV